MLHQVFGTVAKHMYYCFILFSIGYGKNIIHLCGFNFLQPIGGEYLMVNSFGHIQIHYNFQLLTTY